jgi:predicted amidophosphoribosyltransferase
LKPGVTLQNKTVIIVDDVMTTGASLEAAAKLVRKTGAAKVYGLVVAQQPLS